MSDRLTADPTHEPLDVPPVDAARPVWVTASIQAGVIVAVFAAVGVLSGWLWFRLWEVPSGVVSGGQWYTNEAGLRDDFTGLAWYVAIAVLTGLVLGMLAAWLLHRSELVTLAAVLAGSVLAAFVMLRVGQHLSPADPHLLARTAADGTELKGSLRVRAWPPRGAFPFGALLGLAIVYGVSVGRMPAERRDEPASPAGTRG